MHQSLFFLQSFPTSNTYCELANTSATHGMFCSFTARWGTPLARLGPVCVALVAAAESVEDKASPVSFFTWLNGIIPSWPSRLFALYQFGSLDLAMIVRVSPRLKGRSYDVIIS